MILPSIIRISLPILVLKKYWKITFLKIQKISFHSNLLLKHMFTKLLSNLNINKSTGVDKISEKILMSCVSIVSGTISNLINTTYKLGKFPDGLKQAQVLPLYKKKDPLNKENFRPGSLLPIISKIYERSMNDHLSISTQILILHS